MSLENQEIFRRLESFDDDKLIKIIQNYQQYGYSEAVHDLAVQLLSQRGITIEDLKLKGENKNENYEKGKRLFKSFKTKSLYAFVIYMSAIMLKIISTFQLKEAYILTISVATLICFLLFIFFLISAFIDQNELNKLVNNNDDDALLYFTGGALFYFVYYFYKLKETKNKVAGIGL